MHVFVALPITWGSSVGLIWRCDLPRTYTPICLGSISIRQVIQLLVGVDALMIKLYISSQWHKIYTWVYFSCSIITWIRINSHEIRVFTKGIILAQPSQGYSYEGHYLMNFSCPLNFKRPSRWEEKRAFHM